MSTIAVAVIVAFALGLIGLAAVVFIRPSAARRFFAGFASSPETHFGEQFVRLVVGAALIVAAPEMAASNIFRMLGWVIVATAVALMITPWRWHHRFAQRVIPPLLRRMRWYAIGLVVFAAILIGAIIIGA